MLPRFIARTIWQAEELTLTVRLSGFPSSVLAEAHGHDVMELLLRGGHLVLVLDDGTEYYLFDDNLELSGVEVGAEDSPLETLLRRFGPEHSFTRLSSAVEPETSPANLSPTLTQEMIHPMQSDIRAVGWSEEQMREWLRGNYPAFKEARARGELQSAEETSAWIEERLSLSSKP